MRCGLVISGRVSTLDSVADGSIYRARTSQYTLLMRPNKVETAVKWFRISRAVLAGFSELFVLHSDACNCMQIKLVMLDRNT